MKSPREEGDPRSPKRQSRALTFTPAGAHAVVAVDDAVWTTIIEFLPMPKDLTMAKSDDATVFEVVATWRTLLGLRFVDKELAALLDPVGNTTLWRRLVLQCFDFSVDVCVHVETSRGFVGVGRGMALHHWIDATGRNFLIEDLANWSKLGIYHRPSQCGFVSTLQQQPEEGGSRPESEDAFTLFGDLVRLLRLPHGGHMDTGGKGSDPPFKYFAAPVKAALSSSLPRGDMLLKTLGYTRLVCARDTFISDKWKGFTNPDAIEALVSSQLRDRRTDPVDQSAWSFPRCSVGDAARLCRHISQHCRDWRSVQWTHVCVLCGAKQGISASVDRLRRTEASDLTCIVVLLDLGGQFSRP